MFCLVAPRFLSAGLPSPFAPINNKLVPRPPPTRSSPLPSLPKRPLHSLSHPAKPVSRQDERSYQLERYVKTRLFPAHALWLSYLHRPDEEIQCRYETRAVSLILVPVGQAGCQIANSCWEVSFTHNSEVRRISHVHKILTCVFIIALLSRTRHSG